MPTHDSRTYNPLATTSKSTLPSSITTLHASKQSYTSVSPGIREFVNLEVLWLDGNELTSIEELVPKEDVDAFSASHNDISGGDASVNESDSRAEDLSGTKRKSRSHARPAMDSQNHAHGTLRLKELYLHKNRLQVLPPSLCQIKFLRILLLHSNRFRDLDRMMRVIRHFRFLEHLDLFGNPLAEEELYRERVLSGCTSDILRIFDRSVIQDGERDEARKKVREWKKRGATRSLPNKSRGDTTQKTMQKKARDRVVFGKMMRAKDMKHAPPVEEYTEPCVICIVNVWRPRSESSCKRMKVSTHMAFRQSKRHLRLSF
mmetsp:Transcript_9268/g.34276  ORF Transcript_9268/g.34276 Transcript_9268/m.34276 type:complete len:317 (-) Transcript_9268:3750-4700(-)